MVKGGRRHALAALTLGKAPYILYSRLGGPQGQSGRLRNISPTPGLDPRTFQPEASRYTEWAIASKQTHTQNSQGNFVFRAYPPNVQANTKHVYQIT
jgi:hypothetical protein